MVSWNFRRVLFLEQRNRREKDYKKKSQSRNSIFLLHKPQGLFAFCHWKFWTFLEFPDFLDIKKKNLMFNSRIISDHLCFCFLWVICVLWKLRNSVFSSSPYPCWRGHTMDCLSPSLWKEWAWRARAALSGLTFLASASEVKTITREKNIFSSKPKKRTFFLVLAHSPHSVDLSRVIFSPFNKSHLQMKSLRSSSSLHALIIGKVTFFSDSSKGA